MDKEQAFIKHLEANQQRIQKICGIAIMYVGEREGMVKFIDWL